MSAANTSIALSDGAITVATNLRIASLSIAAYEYVASISLPLVVTHTWPAISSPSLWNIGCIDPPIEAGKKTDATLQRYSIDLIMWDTSCRLLTLFILIRYVFLHYRL
jgi:hypothetical protein